jgi:hypothetical protein
VVVWHPTSVAWAASTTAFRVHEPKPSDHRAIVADIVLLAR